MSFIRSVVHCLFAVLLSVFLLVVLSFFLSVLLSRFCLEWFFNDPWDRCLCFVLVSLSSAWYFAPNNFLIP